MGISNELTTIVPENTSDSTLDLNTTWPQSIEPWLPVSYSTNSESDETSAKRRRTQAGQDFELTAGIPEETTLSLPTNQIFSSIAAGPLITGIETIIPSLLHRETVWENLRAVGMDDSFSFLAEAQG